ncbi:MAG TPA: hypothetical protein VFU02_13705 [Polyangiaceae bacterium]|nr:hypothetical protein [Polyangiaceae bacterium]
MSISAIGAVGTVTQIFHAPGRRFLGISAKCAVRRLVRLCAATDTFHDPLTVLRPARERTGSSFVVVGFHQNEKGDDDVEVQKI